jgi:hypothetical protein
VPSPEALMQAGGVISGLGGTLTVSYYIFTHEAGAPFWTWPGIIGLIATSVGLALLLIGFLRSGRDIQSPQHQQGGAHSRNYQAGRDMTLNPKDPDA